MPMPMAVVVMLMAGQSTGVRSNPGAHSAECNVDPVPTKQSLPGRLN